MSNHHDEPRDLDSLLESKVERQVAGFRAALVKMHDDPAETARIDALIDELDAEVAATSGTLDILIEGGELDLRESRETTAPEAVKEPLPTIHMQIRSGKTSAITLALRLAMKDNRRLRVTIHHGDLTKANIHIEAAAEPVKLAHAEHPKPEDAVLQNGKPRELKRKPPRRSWTAVPLLSGLMAVLGTLIVLIGRDAVISQAGILLFAPVVHVTVSTLLMVAMSHKAASRSQTSALRVLRLLLGRDRHVDEEVEKGPRHPRNGEGHTAAH
ncbi:hypothetical protein [Sphaerisporangium sp. TRM90804]|uniref:hypothetical protein n=1 Tax=Sphaerisporangium sp. TRM90804 TaxID=3031113 RepID=UPI0024469FB4|nr:hypothetical protein [Sphaerisporangium sp. TRM90804]MDH2426436.1 hypothetical protein [Sphaerisporangium sp. TRM90804]